MCRLRYGGIVLLLCLITACSSTAPLVVEPTQRLVMPTATDTPIPQTPTITFTPLPRAGDLATATPAASELSSTDSAVPSVDDPVAAELVGLAQRSVARDLSLPIRRVEQVEVKAYTWPDISLGCPKPNETYAKQNVDGYRIVLKANDQQFIFHTDFDRVVVCDPANEKLPESPSD